LGQLLGLAPLLVYLPDLSGGHLSDRFGRKRVMLVSIWLWVLVFIGFAVADHVAIFFLYNAFNGICRSFFEPSSRALLSDLTDQKKCQER
jgi:MFS family permease